MASCSLRERGGTLYAMDKHERESRGIQLYLPTCLCGSSCGGGRNKDVNCRPSIHFSDDTDIVDLCPCNSACGVHTEPRTYRTKADQHPLHCSKSVAETSVTPAPEHPLPSCIYTAESNFPRPRFTLVPSAQTPLPWPRSTSAGSTVMSSPDHPKSGAETLLDPLPICNKLEVNTIYTTV